VNLLQVIMLLFSLSDRFDSRGILEAGAEDGHADILSNGIVIAIPPV
jgi:hypothetical protein